MRGSHTYCNAWQPMLVLSAMCAQVYQLMKGQMGMERSLGDLHPEIEWTAEDEAKESAADETSSDSTSTPASSAPGDHDEL